jgi:hypothetical protein
MTGLISGFFGPSDSTAVAVQPTPAPIGSSGPYFINASLTSNATILSPDFCNGLVNEFLTLSQAGGIPLSASAPTMTQNIINLISFELSGYVKKVGDTMTGPLNIELVSGANSATPTLILSGGAASVNFIVNSPATSVNTMVQAGDSVLYYTDGAINSGALTIVPYGTGSTGGLRFDNTGAATFNRPLVALTPALNDNSIHVATTAYVCGQAGTLTPLPNGTATTGTSLQYARQDHVHPNQTLGGVLTGTLPNPSLAAGVAAANVGTVGGVLSGTLPNPLFAAGGLPIQCSVFPNGVYNWTVPANVYFIDSELWGAGGGSGGVGINGASGGGAGGGYSRKVLTVTPGEVLTVTVGYGGAAGGPEGYGGYGGITIVGNPGAIHYATGGSGGSYGYGFGGQGGLGPGQGVAGDENWNGEVGGAGIPNSTWGGQAGSAYKSPGGVCGGVNGSPPAPSFPGAGGRGTGTTNSVAYDGAPGGTGWVIFRWTYLI